ncbi:hypothetical protein [Leptospira sp. 'Mane']|uniref:hypothetical protein n=1 Tax=Leptospira sp. 'Mane' TaxID=3387407 RepID=UPI00398B5B5C
MFKIEKKEPEIAIKKELTILLERVVLEGMDVSQTIEDCCKEILDYFADYS